MSQLLFRQHRLMNCISTAPDSWVVQVVDLRVTNVSYFSVLHGILNKMLL